MANKKKIDKKKKISEKKRISINNIVVDRKHPALKAKRTPSQKAADLISKIIGSWKFILTLGVFLIFWMILNGYYLSKILRGEPFDPYPFILLNLVLSCIATFQAPIILMSQNRTSQKDRIKAEYDHIVDRKAEREIQDLKKQLDRIEKKLK
jgi:uncharacterized membrane protein